MALNLLTGSTCFVGGYVVEYLFQQNEMSKGTFRKDSRLKTLDLNGVQGVEIELLDRSSCPQAGLELIGYSSEYDLEKTCEDVALWYRREPWIAKSA
jgi:hypothetical protein